MPPSALPLAQLLQVHPMLAGDQNKIAAAPRESPGPAPTGEKDPGGHLHRRLAARFEQLAGRAYEKAASGHDLLQSVARYLAAPHASGHGLLVCGGVGLGKTKIMQAASDVTQAFAMKSTRDVVRRFNGLETPYDKDFFFRRESAPQALPIAYDDLGAELDASNYGRFNLMAEIIQLRYDRSILTHFTTNLTMEELTNRYGIRIADRLREMCYLIEVQGPSRRHAKPRRA